MVGCAVPSCRSASGPGGSPGVSFYNFPKDPARRALWIELTGVKATVNHGRVCSKHFTDMDLDNSYFIKKALMPGANVKHVLRSDAVPSINLQSAGSKQSSRTKCSKYRRVNKNRVEHQEQEERKALVEQLLADYDKELEARSAQPQEVIELIQGKKGIRRLSQRDKLTTATNDTAISKMTTGPRRVKLEAPKQSILMSLLKRDSATAVASPPASLSEPKQAVPSAGMATIPAGPDRGSKAVAAAADVPVESDQNKRRIRIVPIRDNATVTAEAAASYAGSVPVMASSGDFMTGANVEVRSGDAGDLSSDDDRIPSGGDGSVSDGGCGGDANGDPEEDEGALSKDASMGFPRDSLWETQMKTPMPPSRRPEPSMDFGTVTGPAYSHPQNTRSIALISSIRGSRFSPEKSPADGAPGFKTRRSYRRSSLMVERAKEIMRLKMTVRKLEDKCGRVLSVPSSQLPVVDGQETTDADWLAAGADGTPAGHAPASAADTDARETPLMVLRQERGASKLPMILMKMQQYQLSDSIAMCTPSNLQMAQEINHELKVRFLNLQATLLKWAIKNKRLRDSALKDSEQKKDKCKKTVSSARLRELLRLEAAVKSMFTEAQIRAITREHDAIPPFKRKGAPHWGEEDLRRVLELRAISSDRVVEHVRDKMKIPLPSMAATKQRCKKSPELGEAYREMLVKSEEQQRRCQECHRQLTTIDEVIEAAVDELPDDDATYGRQFVQHVPSPLTRSPEQPAAQSRPDKRRRAHATPLVSKKERTPAEAPLDWVETDSDAELSDPGLWSRLVPAETGWHPDDLVNRAPPPPKRPRPVPMTQLKRAWK